MSFMRNKTGDLKYDILMYAILGVLVLSIGFYFIFNELFVGEDLDMEVCRQTIQIRALLPDATIQSFGNPINFYSFKDKFPLKCKTMVKVIERSDVEDIDKANKIIGETMAECWALYGDGDLDIFPSEIYGMKSVCMPCARIHLTEDAKKYVLGNGVEINIRNALDGRLNEKTSYYNYLQNKGKNFAAFSFGNVLEFDLSGDDFSLGEDVEYYDKINFINRFNKNDFWMLMKKNDVSLPKVFNVSEGDLMINYGTLVNSGDEDFGDYIPYLFYFQAGQKNNPFAEVRKEFVFSLADFIVRLSPIVITYDIYNSIVNDKEKDRGSVGFCDAWEGIPA
jgi:hypothetical protein